MSKMPSDHTQNPEDKLLAEYRFNYQKAKPNRFAVQNETQKLTVVVLDEDVAQVFTTPESVNKVLRALIDSMP
jgi:predicted transcriptional regulator